jgi:hypothetical protein
MAMSPIEADGPIEPNDLSSPITPHAAPIWDGEGHLAYIGDDGRRYVVSLPPEADGESVDRVMDNLRQGDVVFQQIQDLCESWISQVTGLALERQVALSLLLATLEVALDPDSQEL